MAPATRQPKRGLAGLLPPTAAPTPDPVPEPAPAPQPTAQPTAPGTVSGTDDSTGEGRDTAEASTPTTVTPIRTARPARTTSTARTAADAEPTQPDGADAPKWTRLVRKDLRLHEDQIDDVTALTRRLKRARGGPQLITDERLTDNSLIRVAVDLLLDHASGISGTTEQELLASLRKLTRTQPRPGPR